MRPALCTPPIRKNQRCSPLLLSINNGPFQSFYRVLKIMFPCGLKSEVGGHQICHFRQGAKKLQTLVLKQLYLRKALVILKLKLAVPVFADSASSSNSIDVRGDWWDFRTCLRTWNGIPKFLWLSLPIGSLMIPQWMKPVWVRV